MSERGVISLKNSNLDKSLRTKLVKEQYGKIRTELNEKFCDTRHIIALLRDHLSDIPESLQTSSPQDYYVVFAPFHPKIDTKTHPEIARFLDDLQGKLLQAIPEQLCSGVYVVLLEDFVVNHERSFSKGKIQ